MESVQIRVQPSFEAVVALAREASVQITGVRFVRDAHVDTLDSLSLNIEGKEHALAYFHYLIENQNLGSVAQARS